MRKKITSYMSLLACIAIAVTLMLASFVFHSNFQDQVFYDLRTTCVLLADMYDASEQYLAAASEGVTEIRITLIGEDGVVRYDSHADPATLDNHLTRPEVQQSLQKGSGQAIRQSDTMSKDTYYYAIYLKDGNVLRISRDADSLGYFLLKMIPYILLALALLTGATVLLSRLLTGHLIHPIKEMAENLSHPSFVSPYPELQPFIQTIKSQHNELKKTSDLRREFTANVSHELKTPLTSISGFAELMETGIIPPEDVPQYAGKIRSSATRLITLINDIIELSRLDSPVQEVVFEQVDLYQIAEKVVSALQVNADGREVTLTLSGSESVIVGNRSMLEELITNLCDNALRYNYRGGKVHVSVIALRDRVILSVQDTGIGIPKKDQERVFERFYRVDKSRSKETGGTGLGLSIVKHIVAQHEADIALTSEPGKGTDIRVIFNPLA